MTYTKRNFKYLRLSIEDDEVDGILQDESNSITNQRRMLNDYLAAHPELGTFEEIVDDGFSGTSFHRPGMERLIRLVEAGEVGTIIVKDLSRFGRNYLEAGYYIELVFPVYQVRLIAVNDFYDTETQKGTAGDITLALNNIKNEMFSRDVSAKVKCTNEIQRRNKQFAGRVPYGYRTGSTKHDIVVDPEAAEVVKKIFYLAAEKGLKNSQIAAELNKEGIMSPSMYKAQKWGYKGKVQTFWTTNSVYYVLINRIYTGCFWMYQGHLNGVGSKSTTTIRREERELIRDTHEAIVPESVYIEAQKVMSHPVKRGQGKNKRLSPPPPVPMLARYLKCGCCRNKLFREHTYGGDYICRSAKVRSDGDCEQVRCDAVALETVVFHSIQRLVELSEKEQQQAQEQHRANEAAAADIKNKIRSLSGKRKGINAVKMKLYEDFKAGKLTMEEFRVQKAEKAREDEAITSQMEELSAELTRLNADREQPMESKPSVSMEIGDRLTPELLKAFVEKVIIAPNGEPEIVFQFKDTFQ